MHQNVTHPLGSICHPSTRLHKGAAAYFDGRDVGRIWRVSEGLEHGIVGLNEGIISTEIAPFGGMKESGIGHPRVHWARNTASRNSSKSNTSAWAASTGNPRLASRATGISGASFLSAKAE